MWDTADLPVSGHTEVGIASQEPKASLQERMEDLKTALAKLDAVLHGLPSDEPITLIIAEDFTFGGSSHIPVDPSWDEVQLLDRIARQYWEGARLNTSGSDELPNLWLASGAHAVTVQLAQGLNPEDLSSLWTSPDYPPSTFQPTLLDCQRYDSIHRHQCGEAVGVGLLSQTYLTLGEAAFLDALRTTRARALLPFQPGEGTLRSINLCDYLAIFTEGANEPVSARISEIVTKWNGQPHDCR